MFQHMMFRRRNCPLMQCFDARKPSHFNQISFDRSTAAYIEFMLCVNIPTMQGVIVINLSIKKTFYLLWVPLILLLHI